MSGWLAGHVALMVGAGSGIGRATVDAFREEGAQVAVLELSPEKCGELRESAPEVLVVEGDARSPADNRRAVRQTLDTFGRIDSAITFVGLFDHRARLVDIPPDRLAPAFEEVFATNVRSVLELAHAAAGPLAAQRGSLIVTLSNSAFYPGTGGVLYVSSKFALRGVIAQLGHELAPDVRVNGVAPGGTLDTDLRGVAALGSADRRSADAEGRAERIRAAMPLRLNVEAGDHAGAYVYLASGRARPVTGTVINSDGGLAVRG